MSTPSTAGNRVLVIVQNLPVPLDRRVWLECQALRDAGFHVSVICPKGPGDPAYQLLDGVALYKYRGAPEAQGLMGYVREFIWSWLCTALLSLRVFRERGFDVIQACNPPDTYWLLAWLWRARGVTFVFDQHDLNPELFLSRFGRPRTLSQHVQYRGLRWLERMTYRVADRVISTNESYRRIAMTRGERHGADVTVVRSGPDTRRMRPVHGTADVRQGAKHFLVYLGIMGPQDGVETVLHTVHELVHVHGRTGVRAALLGFGDCLEDLKQLAVDLRVDDLIEFTGRAGPEKVTAYLSAADVGLCPDAKTPLNDVSTMNKTMEYMAFAVPCVSYDLTESMVSAGETGVFVPSGDQAAFTAAVAALLDDPQRRADLAVQARTRAVDVLDWAPQSTAYVGVFEELLGRPAAQSALPAAARSPRSRIVRLPVGILADRRQVADRRRGVLAQAGTSDETTGSTPDTALATAPPPLMRLTQRTPKRERRASRPGGDRRAVVINPRQGTPTDGREAAAGAGGEDLDRVDGHLDGHLDGHADGRVGGRVNGNGGSERRPDDRDAVARVNRLLDQQVETPFSADGVGERRLGGGGSAGVDPAGRAYVDLRVADELARFVRSRAASVGRPDDRG